jgi:hypothetical protein
MNALVPTANAEIYKASTDAASLCKSIVVETAMTIQGRKYVKVEGWQAIALAHGCTPGSRDVQRVDGGVRAIGEIRRITDGALIAQAEGFVGEDEPTWYGGETRDKWGKVKVLPKRSDYAIRAMAQTRAISRACRSAFAHVVVMMNAGLETTPAEEVPFGGFQDDAEGQAPPQAANHAGDPRDQPKPAANGIKRLSSAQAKERGLNREIEDAINGCTTREELMVWDAEFEKHTAQVPLSWLDSIRNHVILRGEAIDVEQGEGAMDAEFADIVR